ncbi:MAG: hypothetical protein ACKN9V_07620 [Pseudomonadota bacterium]
MLFRPKNSIIVPFDYLGPESFQDFENQLHAIGEHYRFSKLSQIAEPIYQKKRQGFAAIVLENPRKGVLLQAVPALLSQKIPFTLFVDPDYVGLNRLPLEEELESYQRAYPEKFLDSDFQKWCEVARLNPMEADLFLKKCRQNIGPLRVDELDSFKFFTTWGKLLDLPPDLVEFGLKLSHSISSLDQLTEKLRFVETMLKTKLVVLRAPQHGLPSTEVDLVTKRGFKAVLGHELSEVTQATSPLDLPVWKLL